MKTHIGTLILLLMALIVCNHLHAEKYTYYTNDLLKDTVNDKSNKKLKKQEERLQLRNSHSRFGIKTGLVYASLDTKVTFELPDGLLSSTISLEKNLGLPSNSSFFTGSFMYRITPRSGIYAQYYGIKRSENHQTDRDYIFLSDTIPSGININAFFNTQVISTGYLLSVLKDPDTFLGFYFNIYLMLLETGVSSDIRGHNSNIKLVAPLPNFGMVATFKLTKWLYLDGNVGFFSLNTKDFGGSLYDFNLSLVARPVHWLGINLSYQEFDVRIEFPSDHVNTVADYNFKGPSVGMSFIF